MSCVADTDVVSFIFKNDSRGALYKPHLDNRIVIISFMTLAELERWTISAKWGTRKQSQLKSFLRRFVVRHSDAQLCRQWSEVIEDARSKGLTLGFNDAWIAATARLYNIPLVTHNRSHFIGVKGLTVISES